jgi:hypothetical protein
MAFTNNDVSIETRFQLNNSPENFKITDNVDYVGTFGIALADVIGALVIKDPNGNTIHSTALPAFDIDLDVQTYIDSIPLPKDAAGDILQGNYTIDYTVRVSGGVDPGDYTKTFVYKYCYEKPQIDINIEVDVICSTLTSTDITDYPVEMTANTRTHTIVPPAGLPDAQYPDKVVSTAQNVYTPITDKTWTSTISNIIEVTYTDGLIVDDTITGDKEKEIIDDINLCNLQCAMRALVSRYNDASENNPIDADKIYRENLAGALVNAYMYTSNIQCGNYAKAETYYQQVLDFTESEPDCACADSETPTPIVPSCIGGGGSSMTYVVDACVANNAITVTPTVLGDTTTYTVCFNQTLFDKLTALKQTLITSTDNSVTILPTLNPPYGETFDLSVNTSSPAASPVHSFSGIIEIDMSVKGAVPNLGWRSGWSAIAGNKLQEPTIVNSETVWTRWAGLPNCFYLDGYIDQAGGEFPKPIMQIVEVLKTGQDADSVYCKDDRNLSVIIKDIDTGNNRIYFQILDSNYNAYPASGRILQEAQDLIRISVHINA